MTSSPRGECSTYPPRKRTTSGRRTTAGHLRGSGATQHLLEHNFSRALNFDSRVTIAGTPHVGLNVDERVDSDHPPTPCVRPVIDFFSAQTETTVRRTKSALAQALSSKEFADDIVYFGCHGTVDGVGERPYLVLGDGEKIYSSEVVAWLTDNLLVTRPVVFIGACQGGQLASTFYPSFGQHLLERGARYLIGPQNFRAMSLRCQDNRVAGVTAKIDAHRRRGMSLDRALSQSRSVG